MLPEPSDLMQTLRDCQRIIEEAQAGQPVAWRIYSSHKVPFARLYRQWDTKGRLILWVNRGWMEDLPRVKRDVLGDPMNLTGIFGIPVENV